MDAELLTSTLVRRADALAGKLAARGLTLAVAESCTGGLLAAALTENAGASASFVAGYVCYANEAKIAQIGVPGDVIAHYGAVSPQVAEAMARGALRESGATLACAITGIAGPSGGLPEKPVGTVCLAVAVRSIAPESTPQTDVHGRICTFPDEGRTRIRRHAVLEALQLIEAHLPAAVF